MQSRVEKEKDRRLYETDLFGNSLCQVLTRLSLACTRRSFWSTAKIQLQRSHQSATQAVSHCDSRVVNVSFVTKSLPTSTSVVECRDVSYISSGAHGIQWLLGDVCHLQSAANIRYPVKVTRIQNCVLVLLSSLLLAVHTRLGIEKYTTKSVSISPHSVTAQCGSIINMQVHLI